MTRNYISPWYKARQSVQQWDAALQVGVDVRYVPTILAELEARKTKALSLNDTLFVDDYQSLCLQQMELLMGGQFDLLLQATERIYRLLDTSLNGTSYTAAPNPENPDIPLVSPAIPAVPPESASAQNAMRAHLGRLWLLAENAATGASYPAGSGVAGSAGLDFDGSWTARLRAVQGETGGFFGIGSVPVTLADLVKAGRVNTAADQGLINDAVEEVLTAASQGTGIAGVIAQVLDTGADVATDGGLAAVLIASTLAQAATAGALASQLDRIIKTLDGGGLIGPSDNVLATLNEIETRVS